jgi:hypothetical protein
MGKVVCKIKLNMLVDSVRCQGAGGAERLEFAWQANSARSQIGGEDHSTIPIIRKRYSKKDINFAEAQL